MHWSHNFSTTWHIFIKFFIYLVKEMSSWSRLPCNVFMNYNSILNKNLFTWNENKLSLIWIRLFWFGCIVFWIFYFDQRNLTKVVVLSSLEILIDCALSCCNNIWILMNCDIPLKCFNNAFLTMYFVFYLMFQNLVCIVVCLSSTGFQESLNWIELEDR